MKGVASGAAAIALAVAATVALESVSPAAGEWVDLYLIVVVYYAVSRSRVTGIVMGAFVGLVEDVFSSQLLGFHAFVKTGVAYLVGGLGARFMLNQPFPRFLALVLATLLDAGLGVLLSFMVERSAVFGLAAVGRQALINSVLGLMIYSLVERIGARR